MKALMITFLLIANISSFAAELPNTLECHSKTFPVFKNGKGSTLIFEKFGTSPYYHSLSLNTTYPSTVGSAEANYIGVDVFYGKELKKLAFNWVSGFYGGLNDPFDGLQSLELNWGSYYYDKTISLAVIKYVPGSNAQEMIVKFYTYQCN